LKTVHLVHHSLESSLRQFIEEDLNG
jgi:hypothetical protein